MGLNLYVTQTGDVDSTLDRRRKTPAQRWVNVSGRPWKYTRMYIENMVTYEIP